MTSHGGVQRDQELKGRLGFLDPASNFNLKINNDLNVFSEPLMEYKLKFGNNSLH